MLQSGGEFGAPEFEFLSSDGGPFFEQRARLIKTLLPRLHRRFPMVELG
ncbi:MAG: hypothetical protein JSR45_14575 [Proteobacteria bacterium]|nr:hypothetical protein [Pseudomonadota bacterium]